jgi:hypothetical protein
MLAIIWTIAPCRADDAYAFIKENALSCPASMASSLARIVDSPDQAAKAANITQAIMRGECNRTLAMHLDRLETRATPGGRHYSCFHVHDVLGGDDGGAYCAENEVLTTIGHELQTRRGDFKIVRQSLFMAEAACAEGGKVVIVRPKGEQGWVRMSFAFPKMIGASKPILGEVERLLREGCRGVDFADPAKSANAAPALAEPK